MLTWQCLSPLGELSRPIAFAKIIRVMCEEVENGATESGPAEVPPDGDLLVEFSSEDDQDDSRAHDT